jgi:hypothetical protein
MIQAWRAWHLLRIVSPLAVVWLLLTAGGGWGARPKAERRRRGRVEIRWLGNWKGQRC